MNSIRELFSGQRRIDRRIEKVIDYYADGEERLAAEIAEYEATDSVEACFRRFLDVYQAGVQTGQVTEVGIWVSGFYGSGKSSFTKYLGFALDPARQVQGRPFLDLLSERLRATDVRAQLRTVAQTMPTAVIMLDLGAEQLAESSTISVTNVLYWKLLQQVGYSKEKKLAQLEFTLDERGLYADFQTAYRQKFNGNWLDIHNNPMMGIARAAQLLPQFLPADFPTPESFTNLKFEMAEDIRDLAQRMITLARRHTGQQNILFLIDEAGQYVAPRSELILNLDGLARNLKELGQGRVWIVATGQQTLSEITERAAYNSLELNKLRDRFPIAIELDARDIREITYRRLLTKSQAGEGRLRQMFQNGGQAMISHTRLTGTSLFKDDPTTDEFVRYYPFLPPQFNLLMELIRKLASSTGGIGLRSAIRVIQDVLVDSSRILPPDAPKLADRPFGALATVADFYQTLRHDINKQYPHVVAGVDLVTQLYPDDSLHRQVAQAVAALQPLENFPTTAANIAALLYPAVGAPSLLEEVQQALTDLVETKDVGLIDDPQTGGYQFLSENVAPLQKKRRNYVPGSGEMTRARDDLLLELLEPQPRARLENSKDVPAAVRSGKRPLLGDREALEIQLEMLPDALWQQRRDEFLRDTKHGREYEATVVWLFRQDDATEDLLIEVCKSEKIAGDIDELSADRDVAQYARAERRLAGINRDSARARLQEALLSGLFIFRGLPTPVREAGEHLETAVRHILNHAAKELFHQYHLCTIRPATNLAAQFLDVARLDRMPPDRDPLRLVIRQGGTPRIDLNHPALAETMRVFRQMTDDSGGRVTGKMIQDRFAEPPYGWAKDAARYLCAALLVAGELEFHTGGDVLKIAGPLASAAVKNTQSFNQVGLSRRDNPLDMDTLDRAARRLETLFGGQVLPLEDYISKASREHLTPLVAEIGDLPSRLRLLRLPGEERAQELLAELAEILRGDASDAPARLGMKSASLIDDLTWARAANKSLNDQGETAVSQTNALLSQLTESQTLYPHAFTGLGLDERLTDLQAILQSPHFYERMADLRGALRQVQDTLTAQYAELWQGYQTAVQNARARLENAPAWAHLSDEERQELIAALTWSSPTAPGATAVTPEQHRLLLARLQGLAETEKTLAQTAQRLAEQNIRERQTDGSEANLPQTISLRSFLGQGITFTNEADLNHWLEQLGSHLRAPLTEGRPVQVQP